MDDDDAASSVDGEPDRKSESLPGDIDKGPGKRTRRTFEEIAAKRVQDLEKLQQMNVDGWSAKRKENHLRAIDELASKIEQDTAKRNKQASKPVKTASSTQRAASMEDDLSRRLIYARAVMDYEFEKCINAAVSKWEMVAEIFNKGFIAKKSILSSVDADIEFPALPDGENDVADMW